MRIVLHNHLSVRRTKDAPPIRVGRTRQEPGDYISGQSTFAAEVRGEVTFLMAANLTEAKQKFASTYGAANVKNVRQAKTKPEARDHWYVEKRYTGGVQLMEGAGTDGGRWAVKASGKTTPFPSRREAEEYIYQELREEDL